MGIILSNDVVVVVVAMFDVNVIQKAVSIGNRDQTLKYVLLLYNIVKNLF